MDHIHESVGFAMKIKESAENYLETIYMLGKRNGQVRSIDVATELGYSKPSISYAVKRFREDGYLTVDSAGFLRLTPKGLEIAERMYERHGLLSSYLMSIGVCEATALEDACRIEHVISEETFERMKEAAKRRLKTTS